MNAAEEAHIKKHLLELIRKTTCNAELLSILLQKNVLSDNDFQDVQSCKNPLEKSLRLYEILPTKKHAYLVLIGALNETTQSGAASILQQIDSTIQDFGLISADLNQIIGQGRSKVYRGNFNGREVAVKIVQERTEQAISEVNFLKELDHHENIVRYFMAERKNGQVYIALELCCINLEDELTTKMLNPEPVNILRQCTQGISFLHNRRIIHRDLKPANILLDSNGQVKLSDFGFSKQLKPGKSAASVSGIIGTFEWMAPEILCVVHNFSESYIDSKMTIKADIFSLGCVFYFVLSNGKHLFGNGFERAYNIANNTPKWGNVLMDRNIEELIRKMISHLPTQRPSGIEILSTDYFSKSPVNDSPELTQNLQSLKITEKPDDDNYSANIDTTLLANDRTTDSITAVNATSNRNELIARISKTHEIPKHHVDDIKTDINAPGYHGMTFLHYAAQSESVDTIIALLELGCEWRVNNSDNVSVLDFAIRAGNLEVVKYLMALGVDDKAGDNLSLKSPFHNLAYIKDNNFLETVRGLVELGADINGTTFEGCNALMIASRKGKSREELEEIVRLGGDWKAKQNNKDSVLHSCAFYGNVEAVKYFVELGADVNARGSRGETPLHEAAYCFPSLNPDAVQVLRVLVENGADINAIRDDGDSVLKLAKTYCKSSELIEEIIRLGGK